MRKSVVAATAFFMLMAAQAAFAGGSMVKIIGTINGSTIKVDYRGKEMQIRLLGIATPDPHDDKRPILKQLGIEAQDFLKEFTKSGFIYIEFPSGQPVADKDGTVLASAWGGTNSEFINEKLVAEGFGVVDRKQATLGTTLRDQLIKAEDQARGSRKGIWGSFALGKGADVASGKAHQGTYLGVSPDGRGYYGSGEVYYFIIFYGGY